MIVHLLDDCRESKPDTSWYTCVTQPTPAVPGSEATRVSLGGGERCPKTDILISSFYIIVNVSSNIFTILIIRLHHLLLFLTQSDLYYSCTYVQTSYSVLVILIVGFWGGFAQNFRYIINILLLSLIWNFLIVQ